MSMETALIPDRAAADKQGELFVAALPETSIKDDLATMEFPIFSLAKKKDTQIRQYKQPGTGKSVRITPSVAGAATVFDKDFLLFIGSQLLEAKKNGLPISRTIKVDTYRFLQHTGKSTGGNAYTGILETLRRLKGTTIETNITTGGIEQTEGFGLLEHYIVNRYTSNGKGVLEATVTVSDWLYNAWLHYEVLTLDKQYFTLGQALERRLYELARKHAASKPLWRCDIEKLLAKTGSTQDTRRFRSQVREIIENDSLPDYHVAIDKSRRPQHVVFYTRDRAKLLEALRAESLFDWFSQLERHAEELVE